MDKLLSFIGFKGMSKDDCQRLCREWKAAHLPAWVIGDAVFCESDDLVKVVEIWRRTFPNGSPTGRLHWITPTEAEIVAMEMLEEEGFGAAAKISVIGGLPKHLAEELAFQLHEAGYEVGLDHGSVMVQHRQDREVHVKMIMDNVLKGTAYAKATLQPTRTL